jgi:hypothetical protein
MQYRLPSDTWLTEFICAASLAITGILSFLFNTHFYPGTWASTDANPGLSFFAITVGVMHIIMLSKEEYDVKFMRALVCWLSGAFWTWLAVSSAAIGVFNLHALGTISLGFGCYYAFTVNTIVASRKKDSNGG